MTKDHEVAPVIEKIFNLGNNKEEGLIHKTMYSINTFQAHEDEVYLRGIDEYDNDFQICFNSYDFLEWVDKKTIEYIKEQLIKYIKKK